MMIMTKQEFDVSKWMRVNKNLKWYCGNERECGIS